MTDLERAIRVVAQHCMNYPMREVRISWLEVQAELRRLQETEQEKAEPHRHMQFSMDGGPITEYECESAH